MRCRIVYRRGAYTCYVYGKIEHEDSAAIYLLDEHCQCHHILQSEIVSRESWNN